MLRGWWFRDINSKLRHGYGEFALHIGEATAPQQRHEDAFAKRGVCLDALLEPYAVHATKSLYIEWASIMAVEKRKK